MGSLHIEMIFLSALGIWLEDSGWAILIYNSGVARVGIAKSLSSGSNVVHSRYCYQVPLCALYRSQNEAFGQYFRNEDVVKHTYAEWRTVVEGKFPQFALWSITMRMIRDLLIFVRYMQLRSFFRGCLSTIISIMQDGYLCIYMTSIPLKMAICAFT